MNRLEDEVISSAKLLCSLKFITREKRDTIIMMVKSPGPNTTSNQQTTEAR